MAVSSHRAQRGAAPLARSRRREYAALLERYGIEKPTKIGLLISGERIPNHEEIRVAVVTGRRTIVRLRSR